MELLNCLKCNAPLQESDLNKELGVAKCGYCDAWIKIDELRLVENAPTAPKSIEGVPIPAYLQFNETEDKLQIVFKWTSLDAHFRGRGAGMGPFQFFAGFIPFGVTVAGFLLLIFLFDYFGRARSSLQVMPLILLVGMFVFAVLAITKVVKKLFRNKEINVRRGGQLYCQTPLLGSSRTILPVQNVRQLYCTSERGLPIHANGGQLVQNTLPYYSVNAVLKDNKTHVVFSGIEKKMDAILIERTIEQFLGIEDEPVPGEAS